MKDTRKVKSPPLVECPPERREAPVLEFHCDGCRRWIRQRGFFRPVSHLMFCSKACETAAMDSRR